MSGEYNRSEVANGNTSTPSSPVVTSAAPAPAASASNGASNAMAEQVDKVINSDIGVATLLNRLKQSIASARDFASFLSKRSKLEEEHAQGLKRMARSQLEGLRRSEVKGGGYAAQLAETMKLHEKMGENGMQFALSLHQMCEDLNELCTNMEKGRKQWKHEGLDAEKRASDAEAAMHKAKARYDGLAEDYDRARTGDTKGSRRIGLKGPKSAEQYEQELLRKVQASDQEYEERVKTAKNQRQTLLARERPKAVKALQELIAECDSALTLQLQKFATFNEKLLLGNGLVVSPLTKEDKTLRDIIYDIDNETDFNAYMRGHVNKIPARPSEIKYEQHHTLMPKTQKPSQPASSQAPSLSLNTSAMAGTMSSATAGAASNQGGTSSATKNSASTPAYGKPPSSMSYSQPPPPSHQVQSPSNYGNSPAYGSGPTAPFNPDSYGAPAPPYPTHGSERNDRSFSPSGQPYGQSSGTISPQQGSFGQAPPISQSHKQSTMSPSSNAGPPSLPPLRPVFGVSLEELFARDASAVPTVVMQCIQAVDTYGLDYEGIYRVNGNAQYTSQLKNAFNHNANSSQLDFRNPENFFHDVPAVASLLKQFFRDLPDPLFPRAAYSAFLEAAQTDEPTARRDALHQQINDLPDPNYATLRALVSRITLTTPPSSSVADCHLARSSTSTAS